MDEHQNVNYVFIDEMNVKRGCGCSGCLTGPIGCIGILYVISAVAVASVVLGAIVPAAFALVMLVFVSIPSLTRKTPRSILFLGITLSILLVPLGAFIQQRFIHSEDCDSVGRADSVRREISACLPDQQFEGFSWVPAATLLVGIPAVICVCVILVIRILERDIGVERPELRKHEDVRKFDKIFLTLWQFDDGLHQFLGRPTNTAGGDQDYSKGNDIRVTIIKISEIRDGDFVRFSPGETPQNILSIQNVRDDVYEMRLASGEIYSERGKIYVELVERRD